MDTVLTSEKRLKPRYKAEQAYVEIPLSFPKGLILRGKVVDISSSGLSFTMPQGKGCLLPRTPIKDFVIYQDGQKQSKSYAEVAHVKECFEEGEKSYKVGIAFRDAPSEKKHKNYKFRETRFTFDAEQLKGLVDLSINGTQIEATLHNLSRFGAAFEVENTGEVFRVSDSIKNLEIKVNDEIIYKGSSTIASAREEDGKLIVGVTLKDGWVDLERLEGIKKKEDLKHELSNLLDLNKIKGINPEFKAQVADLRYFLELIKNKMDEEEIILKGEVESKRIVHEKYVLQTAREFVQDRLDEIFASLNFIYTQLPKTQDDLHRAYFQRHLHPLLLLSPFLKRIYSKPLGYVGDFEMMIMVYKNEFQGDSLFAKLLNKYTMEISAARANRNRVKYLTNQLIQNAEVNDTQIFRFASIASGPALEIQNFVKKSKLSDNCDITLMDFEKQALEYSYERIYKLKTALKRNLKVRFYEFPVMDFIHTLSRRETALLEEQDLIYCSGLFEYLPDGVCKKLIEILLNYLKPKGRLIMGNYDPSNPFRAYMDLAVEWFMIYRNKSQLLDLVKDMEVSKYYCESEELGLNNFLVLEK